MATIPAVWVLGASLVAHCKERRNFFFLTVWRDGGSEACCCWGDGATPGCPRFGPKHSIAHTTHRFTIATGMNPPLRCPMTCEAETDSG
ncbi:hypothetical protein E2C01_065506 [Portunus trituberculatus]|uniref:Uncharacterized protein n=1 Tax=Portunus trituberculatus TaxID=210409 RepID=A0A5B7HRX7_PORTR|nr:hypothetical protein [Portunus trituberculatus]